MPAIVEVWQVGAHFKALVKGVLVAPSILRCLFFLHPKRGLENNVLLFTNFRCKNRNEVGCDLREDCHE